MPTIKQLLTSNGYTGRPAIACDASTVIDHETVRTLREYNYQIIGRYLTGNVATGNGGVRSKAMTHEELSILALNGIRVFPIYQDGGYYHEYFVQGRGRSDAWKAIRAANELGFPSGTTIYFAVDYDAYGFQVENNIIPYLEEVRSVIDIAKGKGLPEYKLGVYGSRNTCIQAQGGNVSADYSFVGNMSTGYSGNLGFPMPKNWSFNQFHEMTIGLGGIGLALLGIDKNDYSGKDPGVSAVNPPDTSEVSKEYRAKHDAFIEIGKNIPGLQEFSPELFATNINFSATHRAFNIGNIVTVDVEFSEQLNPPTEGGTTTTLQVTPDGINGSHESLLGDNMAQFTQNRLGFYEDFIDNIATSIGTGAIQMTLKGAGTSAELKVTAFKEEIPVEGGGNLQLAVTVIFTVDIDMTDVTDAFTSKEAKVVGAVLGFVFLLALAVKTPAIVSGIAVASAIALLIGDQDDIDDGSA
ncbi:glycoside hydrolase domain-containing protein [Virgibacillus dokdonensis]|nr:glycoside hydrolase domain-containing protein [Virgibacillus dokdonensis]